MCRISRLMWRPSCNLGLRISPSVLALAITRANALTTSLSLLFCESFSPTNGPIVLDRGAGGEEAERVDALVAKIAQPELLQVHDGSYASFASHIAQSHLYVGYDSAGQHVAAAAGVPLGFHFYGLCV